MAQATDEREDDDHYLFRELVESLRTDPHMARFLRQGTLDGLWFWDLEDPEHEWMSPEFWELFGIDPATKRHLASEWQDIIFPDDGQLALENFERHCADPAHPYDQVVRYRHADGSTVWVRCRGLAIRDESGRPIRMLGAHNDLTAEKRLEAELKEQILRAETANQELASFAYATSHDLKSPVNTLRLLLSELQHELGDAGDEVRSLLQHGIETADRAAGVIDDVLGYTRVVGEELELEPVELTTVVDSVLSDLEASISASGAVVETAIDADLVVDASATQLRLLLSNLLDNALKFRRPDVEHRVLISAGRRPDGGTVVGVEDNGIGIDEAQTGRIFQMFERLRPRTEHDGAGLGLALCRRIVLNHGGTIEVRSTPGAGSTFEVVLPDRRR